MGSQVLGDDRRQRSTTGHDPARKLFIAISSLGLVEALFYSVLAPLLPYYARHLHASTSQAGFLTASYAIGAVATAIPAGLIATRVGARRTTVGGTLMLAMGPRADRRRGRWHRARGGDE
jgi:MFS family permease